MKRNLLLLLGLLLVLTIKAQEPTITATGSVGVERTISVGLNAVGTIKVDWGDGTLVEKTTTQPVNQWGEGTVEFTGTPAGDGTIKIYGEGIVYLDASGKKVGDDIPAALTAIDVTKATDLTELYLNMNKLTTIDVSQNTKLTKLNIANNQFTSIDLAANTELTNFTANDNQLTALNVSNNEKLTTIMLNNNKITTLDFSNNKVLKTFNCLNNELTSVTIGANEATKQTFQFGDNNLTSIDFSQVVNYSGAYVRLRNNELTQIILPGKVSQLWADGNALTLAQLYELKSQANTLTYATTYTKEYAQKPYEIPETINVNETVDLSSQATLGTAATVFTWKNTEGTELVEGTDYTVAGGVFTFLTEQEAIHCEMTNSELPLFTGAKVYITTTMKVKDPNAPVITATGSVGVERTISVGLNAVGTIKVDWGDGTLVEKTTTQPVNQWGEGTVEFTGTPAGDGTIKIYGEGIVYLDASGKKVGDDIPAALTAIDVTKATDLTELYLNMNKLTTIDVSQNTKLTKLNIANNQFTSIDLAANTELTNFTANDNQLTALNVSNNEKLTTIMLNNNKITTLDFSNNKVLKTFNCLNNELTSVTIGANEATKQTFQFGDNNLTSIDFSQVVNYSGAYVRLRNNELTQIILPGKVSQLWADGNALTLAQLYELKSQANTLTYATTYTKEYAQKPYEIPETINVNETVDLSSQATLGTAATVFTWKNTEGTELVEGTDYTVAGGVFTFLTEQEAIHCEMTNSELPLFTGAKVYITTTMKVGDTTGISSLTNDEPQNGKDIWFNMNGQRIAKPTQKGLYIHNGKKVIVK